MITKSSKPFLVTLSLISLVFLLVLVFGIYDIKAKNKKILELLSEADSASETGELAQSIKTTQTNAGGDLDAFDKLVLTSGKLVPLIESIETAGRGLGLETKIVSVGKIEDKKQGEPSLIRLVLETQGAWAQTLAFLRAIENLPYRVMIDESSLLEVDVNWRLRITLALHSFD